MTARQYPQGLFAVSWSVAPAERVKVERVLPDPAVLANDLPADVTTFYDQYPVSGGEDMEWVITGLDSAGVATVTLVAQPAEYTFGEVNVLETDPRYTTLARVKEAVGVDAADTTWDTQITETIVASETAMDHYMGRSFPDTGLNPRWPGIPQAIVQAATNITVGMLKVTDAPFGTAGGDGFIGELDVTEQVRREFMRSPMLRGFKIDFGTA